MGDVLSPFDRLVRFFLMRKLVSVLMVVGVSAWGLVVAPFAWDFEWLYRDPLPVDAIPNIGENQQIVFSEWVGRSPQDVEDQVTYPLTVALLGIPGVETIRSFSMLSFSSIYIIFEDDVDFYWSRSRILEKINSLPAGVLPEGVQSTLGPDATGLGQVFWYTLEGRDEQGMATGGWDLHELRKIQDWQVRHALMGAKGVSEVASVGGYAQEYQIDVDPNAMRGYDVNLEQIFRAVKMSNREVSARTIEINRAEYVIRGIGFVKGIADLEKTVVAIRDNIPIYVENVARVVKGPALRRGALDKEGAEVVGGVVVARYDENPIATLKNVKTRIAEIASSLPSKILPDGRMSQVHIVPFYDRTTLIQETLGTLERALSEEILITIIVVMVMVLNVRSAVLVSGLLPLAVLMCFAAMKAFEVDANIVALSGIAIAIGNMVDMGIVVSENVVKRLEETDEESDRLEVVFAGIREVGGSVLTAVLTTVVGFLPVFVMEGAEGKLFTPLALTKTFAMLAALWLALTVLPPLAHALMGSKIRKSRSRQLVAVALLGLGLVVAFSNFWLGLPSVGLGVYHLVAARIPDLVRTWASVLGIVALSVMVTVALADYWLPLGPEQSRAYNLLFVAGLIGGLLLLLRLLQHVYPRILAWCLRHKAAAMLLPLLLTMVGTSVWLGFARVFGFVPSALRSSAPFETLAAALPGLGREFMPPLDEGSFLWMPTTMPHVSIGEALDVLQKQDMAITQIPEVASAVGKLGRAETPLDPAPISMIETIVNYHPEYLVDSAGRRRTFAYDVDATDFYRDRNGKPIMAPDGMPYRVKGEFRRDSSGQLIPEVGGQPFRLWRPALSTQLNTGRVAWEGIRTPDDIWAAIARAGAIPGTTSAPKLQPIAARIVMLQSGMRAPMGIKIKGPSLEAIERTGLELERFLKKVPTVEAAAVNAERMVGKPYLEIHIDREAIARYGIVLQTVQDVIEMAIGGKRITTTIEGRERYGVRVRYMRELRDSVEELEQILVAAPDGVQIPLGQLAELHYARGPQVIKSEDTFLVGYVLFDKKPGHAEVDVVEQCRAFLEEKRMGGELVLDAGVSYTFAGSYENQLRAQKKLSLILPLALAVIFVILYLHFGNVHTTLIVFSGVAVAWSGGFAMLWLYGQGWFLDFSILDTSMRELFQIRPLNLSVAVWVGFLALFGIATDNGVIVASYLRNIFAETKPQTAEAMREAAHQVGVRRIRPCLMTAATTILALIPVLTATGRGADIMVPMAIPTIGGIIALVMTVYVVPVLYCAIHEWRLRSVIFPLDD